MKLYSSLSGNLKTIQFMWFFALGNAQEHVQFTKYDSLVIDMRS